MTLAVGVNAHSYFEQQTDRLTIVDLLAGGMTDIPLDAEGASAFLFGGSVQWSPDGRQFAFSSQSLTAAGFDVRVCNADGSGLRTVLSAENRPGPPIIWDSWAVYDWWPDSSGLLVSWTDLWVASGNGAGKILKVSLDGAVTTLYDDPGGVLIGKANNNYMALSPDGSQIVVVCDRGSSFGDARSSLRVMPSSGGVLTQIYADSTYYPSLFLGCVAWRPGPKIVFMTPGDTMPRIYTINGDGSGLQLVAENGKFSAVWASDTQLLTIARGSGTNPLALVDLAGHETVIPNTVGYWGGEKMSIGFFPLPSGIIRARPSPGGVRLLPGWDRESA